jgi:HSP20 family molecular chaperone IbpA
MDAVLYGQQRLNARIAEWRPPSDIHETPTAILVKMELAGMREEDIDVTLYEDALVVSGRRDDDAEHASGMSYHEAQIRYGPFCAEILLPCTVQRDGVEARYENGFLRVTLPKVATTQGEERRADVIRGSQTRSPSQPLQAGAGEVPAESGAFAGVIQPKAGGPRSIGPARGGLGDA